MFPLVWMISMFMAACCYEVTGEKYLAIVNKARLDKGFRGTKPIPHSVLLEGDLFEIVEFDGDEVNEDDIEGVIHAEKDAIVQVADGVQQTEKPGVTLWHLDRIDQTVGLDGMFVWDNETEDIDIYIVDTGVYMGHTDFGERVLPGKNIYDPSDGHDIGGVDCNGHGTHVASLAAGTTYGVAKQATIIPVKAMGCDGKGTVSAIVKALQYAIFSAKSRGRKSVVNMSITSPLSQVLNTATEAATRAGMVVVVAAGNSNSDACQVSPASVKSVLTVGAISPDDSMLPISSYGPCVDIFAPGYNVIGASVAGEKAFTAKSGTSMASPLAAGVAAVLWVRYPSLSNVEIVDRVKEVAVPAQGLMNICKTQIVPNRILHLPQLKEMVPPTSYLAQWTVLGGVYRRWMSGYAKNGDLCVQFNVKADKDAIVLMAIATESCPVSLAYLWYLAPSCRKRYFHSYEIHMRKGLYATLRLNDVRVASSMLEMSKLPRKVAVRIDRSGPVATLNVTDGMGREILSYRDTSASKRPYMEVVAFSSFAPFDVAYNNIRAC